MTGEVYFIRAGDAIKIGYSKDHRSRLSDLQTGNAQVLELLLVVAGTTALEKQIHRSLKEHRLSGEWFTDCHAVRELIGSMSAGALVSESPDERDHETITLIIPREALVMLPDSYRAVWDKRPQIAFLEVKRPGGRLSVAQEAFRDDVTAIGCLWDLVYSTDRAAEVLRKWGALHPSLTNTREAA